MPDVPLAIEVVPSDNMAVRVLRLTGPLTLNSVFDFQPIARAADSRSTIVDMTRVPYVDSAGIGCLIGAHVSHEREGRKFVLVGVNERVFNVLKITRVENVLLLYSEMEQATNATTRIAGD